MLVSLSRRALLSAAALPIMQAIGQTRRANPGTVKPAPTATPALAGLAPDDDAFLEELEKANFQFFWEQTDPQSGLTKDRCHVRENDNGLVASIATTGFALTALCIGQQRGYVSYQDARGRALSTLRFLWKSQYHHRGFFYHFANIHTGERIWDSEISSIDTAILMCGVLTCRQHFHYPEITRLATDIFERIEWTWLSEDTALLPHGWSPEGGFLPYRWDYYSELMMMYLLGLGSTSHPLPEEAWNSWKRMTFDYEGMRYIGSFAPLFINQYSHAWFDLRGKRDKYADYFENSKIATEVHRRFCIELGKQFPDYSEDLWGITASDSEHGYVVWGGPPETGPIDGTVVPSAPAGSLVFLPHETLRVLRHMKNQYGDHCWCRYGFVNAFNPLRNWFDGDVVGIDTGITMIMAENLRTGFVWDTFMKNREAQKGLERAGFKAG
ncbi:MAG TPA: glucoamylase family protein [Bryobacteraceae bacterium]|jgi:hypothetical protein